LWDQILVLLKISNAAPSKEKQKASNQEVRKIDGQKILQPSGMKD
jgi:hypothetical protein